MFFCCATAPATEATSGEIIGFPVKIPVGIDRHVWGGAATIENFPVRVASQAKEGSGPAIAASAYSSVEGVGAGEDPGERVIIPSWNRIELVIVATCAADCQAEEPARSGIDLIIDDLEFGVLRAGLVESFGADGEEAGGDQKLVPFRLILVREEIAGDLFMDEAIIRLIGVEGIDHVVAIFPGVGIVQIAVESGGFPKAGDVEPVPAPLFPELTRGQKMVDQILVGVG